MKEDHRHRAPEHRQEKILLALMVVAGLISYFPALGGEFLWDDPEYVAHNENLRTLAGLGNIWFKPDTSPQYYPLTFTSFWIEYQIFGNDPRVFHLTNVLLHASSAILLWRLLKRLDVPGALLAAGIFALHPVMVESVAWITERKNTLSLLLYLCAANTFPFPLSLRERVGVRGASTRKQSGHRSPPHPNPLPEGEGTSAVPGQGTDAAYVVSLILFVGALLSKSVTATLPAALLVILWWKNGAIRRIDVLRTIPFFVLGIVLALNTARIEALHVGADASRIPELDWTIPQRILIAGRVPWFYLSKLIAPVNLSFIYPRWEIDPKQLWQWLFPVALALTIACAFATKRYIGRAPLAGILIFVGTLFPVLGFVAVYPMRFSYVADHFQYHASIAMIALFSAAVIRLPRAHWWATILLLPLAALTWNRAQVYRDRMTLWSDTLKRNPDSWMVNANLGHVYFDQGMSRRDAKSMEMAKSLYLRARDLNPHWHETHLLVGNILLLENDLAGADEALRSASELNPDHAVIWFTRGEVARRQQRWNDAIHAYQRALEIHPGYEQARKALLEARAATQPNGNAATP